jgi:hypothetical protein
MMKKTLLVSLFVAMLVIAGCQVVHVTDESGKAINMARVQVATQTGASGTAWRTNMLGDAAIPLSSAQQGTREYLEISKDGYITRRIPRPEDQKVPVQLRKVPSMPSPKDSTPPSVPAAAPKTNAQTK